MDGLTFSKESDMNECMVSDGVNKCKFRSNIELSERQRFPYLLLG